MLVRFLRFCLVGVFVFSLDTNLLVAGVARETYFPLKKDLGATQGYFILSGELVFARAGDSSVL